jgi:hypothetical protein
MLLYHSIKVLSVVKGLRFFLLLFVIANASEFDAGESCKGEFSSDEPAFGRVI